MTENKHYGWMSKKTDEGWEPDEGKEIGRVSRDGHIENTDYQFKRPVVGGRAIGEGHHKTMVEKDDGSLEEPLTGDKFEETRSGKGYWSPVTRRFFRPYTNDKGE